MSIELYPLLSKCSVVCDYNCVQYYFFKIKANFGEMINAYRSCNVVTNQCLLALFQFKRQKLSVNSRYAVQIYYNNLLFNKINIIYPKKKNVAHRKIALYLLI